MEESKNAASKWFCATLPVLCQNTSFALVIMKCTLFPTVNRIKDDLLVFIRAWSNRGPGVLTAVYQMAFHAKDGESSAYPGGARQMKPIYSECQAY